MSKNKATPKKGKITFIENHRPPLLDGKYTITVEQKVKNKDSKAPAGAKFDETYRNVKSFQVNGERFAIESSQIESVFPPQNSQGEYKNVLPHIVFNRTTLPWERTADDAENSSWLALLLFDENDPIPEIKKIMVGDLQREPFARSENGTKEPSNLPKTFVSYPNFKVEYGEQMYDPCLALDVPVDTFNKIIPGVVDLPWLSSSRIIIPEDPARMGLKDEKVESIETSVVVCNRLPEANTQCSVFLVSLEGMASYLPTGDDYKPAPIKLDNGKDAEAVRVVVLSSWSYQSVDPEQSFTGLLKSLDKKDNLRVFSIKDEVTGTSQAELYVKNSLKMGYTPLNHHTRQGCETVSWYRGPFVPFEVPPTIFIPVPDSTPVVNPIETADQVVRYNPETGMMDVTYAAAWQIGRLLAIQDKGFSQALYNWSRSVTQQVFLAFEREILEEEVGQALNIKANDHRNDPLLMQHATANFINTQLGPDLIKKSYDYTKNDNSLTDLNSGQEEE